MATNKTEVGYEQKSGPTSGSRKLTQAPVQPAKKNSAASFDLHALSAKRLSGLANVSTGNATRANNSSSAKNVGGRAPTSDSMNKRVEWDRNSGSQNY